MIDPARTVQLATGALLDPEATWRSYLGEAGDWQKTAVLLTGPLIIGAAVIAYALGFLSSGVSMFGLRPTLVSTVLSIVTGAVGAAIVAFIFSAVSGALGGKGSFALGLAATTLAFVPGYAGQALSGLPWLGWLLALGLGIYGLVLLWRIIPLYLEVPSSKRVAHYVVSLVASIVAFIVLSAVVGGVLGGARNPTFSGLPGANGTRTGAPETGLFGGLARQGEILAAAQEERYTPPNSGELTERQVQQFIRVMERLESVSGDQEQRLREIAERADRNERVSLQDLGSLIGGATAVAGLNTAEIELVKSGGGNWAEHQWVKQSLRTAWLQQDLNDAVAHNYALYQKYEEQLSKYVAQ